MSRVLVNIRVPVYAKARTRVSVTRGTNSLSFCGKTIQNVIVKLCTDMLSFTKRLQMHLRRETNRMFVPLLHIEHKMFVDN